jgi:hypothetical protein
VFSFFPTFFRALGLVFVLSAYFLTQPLGVLPEGVHWTIDALHGWEVVSLGTWLTAVVLYLLYFGFSLVKNNLYTGQPGAEIHFMKHEKIVKTLRPGEWSFVLDPRVRPTRWSPRSWSCWRCQRLTATPARTLPRSTAGPSA